MTDETSEVTVRFDVAPLKNARAHQEIVVYGHPLGDDTVVFVPEDTAQHLTHIYRAISGAATWGELKAALDPRDYETAYSHRRGAQYDAYDQALEPGRDEPFSEADLAFYEDSGWPPNPVVNQKKWMPPAAAALGEYHADMMIGPTYISFGAEQESAVIAALQAHGYTARRDEALCTAAMGPNAG